MIQQARPDYAGPRPARLTTKRLLPRLVVSLPLVAAGWLLVLAVAVLQTIAVGSVTGARASAALALRVYGPLVFLWAVATPAIFASTARWPIRRPQQLRRTAIHAGFGLAFIVLANVLIRLPDLGRTASGADFGTSLALGLTIYLPTAFLAYAVLVAIGHRLTGGKAHLTLRAGDGTALIPPEEIDWIEAANNVVRIHARGRVHTARRPLSDVARDLDPGRFVRVHRSHIVAVSAVRELRPTSHGDAEVLLRDGTALRVTRSRRAEFEATVRGATG